MTDQTDKAFEAWLMTTHSGDPMIGIRHDEVWRAACRWRAERDAAIAEIHKGCPVIAGGNICGCDALIADAIRKDAGL